MFHVLYPFRYKYRKSKWKKTLNFSEGILCKNHIYKYIMNVPVKRIKTSSCCNILFHLSCVTTFFCIMINPWGVSDSGHCNVVLLESSSCQRHGGSDTEVLSWSNESQQDYRTDSLILRNIITVRSEGSHHSSVCHNSQGLSPFV